MTEVTHVVISRDTNKLEIRVRFGVRFMLTSWSCQSTKSWPNIQDASDVVPPNEYALVLRWILVSEAHNFSARVEA
jgi:hypothetical protein